MIAYGADVSTDDAISTTEGGKVNMRTRILLMAGAAALVAASAQAVPAIDGKADAEYGAALGPPQNTNTSFGNATSGDPINGGGGSEIDQVFAKVSGGRLYVLIAGNLEPNFNKVEVFIDSAPGGVNDINGGALPHGVDPYCCGGFTENGGNPLNEGALQRMNTLTFDSEFQADHYLTFTHGFESALSPNLGFYALSAHYADLTNGLAGASSGLGIQLAQRGLPRVLRGTTRDFDTDGDVDGTDFMIWQRNQGALSGATRKQGDADFNNAVNDLDLAAWRESFGFNVANATFGANYFQPSNAAIDNSNALLGPTLPGLSQGDLIDKTYAFGPGGATNNAGAGAITRELEFVLPQVEGDTTNAAGHRNMQNTVDLKMAMDDSNVAGVDGGGDYSTPTAGNPQAVTTGIEFSIPIDVLNGPTNVLNSTIKITAFINNGFHNFLANQVTGFGVLQGNIGGAMPDFELEFSPGDEKQYVEFPSSSTPTSGGVPEPAAATLLAMACLGLGMSRRQR
jgi:hypothetical protein